MNIQQEILNNINTRYVLLKREDTFSIIDKRKRTMVLIDDPIIDKAELIKAMLKLDVEVYHNPKDLPIASEQPIKDSTFPSTIKVFVKNIYDQNQRETGAILTAMTQSHINIEQKKKYEKLLENYAFTVLYPGKGLTLFSEVNSDTVSLVVIKGINNLPYQNIDEQQLFDW